jgi:hypothetical protein
VKTSHIPGAQKLNGAAIRAVQAGTKATGKAPTAAAKVVTSQATKLIDLATSEAEYFHSPEGKAFASFRSNDHTETYPVRSKGFRLWLQRRYFEAKAHALTSKALQDAIGVLEGNALFDGQEQQVFYRVAQVGNRIFLDLGGPAWEAVEISASGWSVIRAAGVKFRRSRGMMPIVPPVHDPSAEAWSKFFNTDPKSDDLKLIVAWLLAALRSKGPYPVLALNSQAGSGKSTASRCLRLLLDPNESPVRSLPKDERDLMIAATNSHILAFDNVSHLPDWFSDAICRLSTGGGFATRELHTDEEEILFNVQRPVLLNGIEEITTRGDLMDRAIVVQLPRIPPDKRRTEEEFWADFEGCRAALLGSLLNAVALGLKEVGQTKLSDTPRMADFAQWVVACERALGWKPGIFQQAYAGNRKESNELTLDASPIARHLMEIGSFESTATDLLKKLESRATDSERRMKGWPQSPRGLSNSLRRLLPSLAEAGVLLEFSREDGGNRERKISIKREREQSLGR